MSRRGRKDSSSESEYEPENENEQDAEDESEEEYGKKSNKVKPKHRNQLKYMKETYARQVKVRQSHSKTVTDNRIRGIDSDHPFNEREKERLNNIFTQLGDYPLHESPAVKKPTKRRPDSPKTKTKKSTRQQQTEEEDKENSRENSPVRAKPKKSNKKKKDVNNNNEEDSENESSSRSSARKKKGTDREIEEDSLMKDLCVIM